MLVWTPKSSPPRARARRSSEGLVGPRRRRLPWGRGFLFTFTWSVHQCHVATMDSPKKASLSRAELQRTGLGRGAWHPPWAGGAGNNLGRHGLEIGLFQFGVTSNLVKSWKASLGDWLKWSQTLWGQLVKPSQIPNPECCLEREGLSLIVFSSGYLRDSSVTILHSRSRCSLPSLRRVTCVLGQRLLKGPTSFNLVL